MMLKNRRSVALLFCLAVALATTASVAGRQVTPSYDPLSLQPERSYYSQLPWETVDMINGNLILTFTDLVLPGNAGMDLRIQRTFNKQINGSIGLWHFGMPGVPREIAQPEGAPGFDPILRWPDGNTRGLRPESSISATDVWVSEDFMRYTVATRTLQLPNGWVAVYSQDPGRALLLSVQDPFENRIEVEWDSYNPQDVTIRRPIKYKQFLGGPDVREVTLDYATAATEFPSAMHFLDRHWSYPTTGSPAFLEAANPPIGPSWQFAYGNSLTVTTPSGGTVEYIFADQVFPDDGLNRKVVRTRVTGGRDVIGGTWTFTYEPQTGSHDGSTGTVDAPNDRHLVFHHEYAGITSKWLLARKSLLQGSTEVSKFERTYRFFGFIAWGSVTPNAVPEEDTLTQDGKIYTTSYEYAANDSGARWGDYHRPFRIERQGDLKRVTTRVFDYDFQHYILDKVSSETVFVDGIPGSFTTSRVYDNEGFLESENMHGISTTFERTIHGNRWKATDATPHTTEFSYQWGVLKDTKTPLQFMITRAINQDGTLAFQTSDGATISYAYEKGRLTGVALPVGLGTTTTYASDGSSITECRGAATCTTTSFDGFGRPRDVDGPASRTVTTYDVDGRTIYASYPFTGGGSGTGEGFEHDTLGRIKRVMHPDGSQIRYDYNGISGATEVVITDENGHLTKQRWATFSPGDARLASLVDPANKTWSYSYNTVGSLTAVIGSGLPNREWTYNGRNEMIGEHHPESQTSGFEYEVNGNLHRKADFAGKTFRYSYDANDRVTFIDVGSTENVAIDYDNSDNRTRVENGTVKSTFDYDDGSRMTRRTDIVAGKTFVTEFGYDARDNLILVKYPTGREVRYGIDDADRIIKVDRQNVAQPETYADNIQYHASGAVGRYTNGNGVVEEITLDGRQRPDVLTAIKPSNPAIVSLDYNYDAGGNVTRLADGVDGSKTSDFGYDALDRLLAVFGFGAAGYSYDDLGNRQVAAGLQYSYGPTLRMTNLAAVPGGSCPPDTCGNYGYDAVGNLSSDPATAYTYNRHNMLATATRGGVTTNYGYDGDNVRKTKWVEGVSRRYYVHGQGGQLIAEYVSTGGGEPVTDREYVYLGSRLLASIGRQPVAQPALTVTLTSPSQNQSFPSGTNVALSATVSVPGNMTFDRVEFWQGGTFIGSDTGAPYQATWTNAPAGPGPFTFIARVVTTQGYSATSAPVTITITGAPAPAPDSPADSPPLSPESPPPDRERTAASRLGGVR